MADNSPRIENPLSEAPANWSPVVFAVACSDIGMRRANNQDSYAIVGASDADKWQRSGDLLIVADGMGAHAAGELASRLSVELIPHHSLGFSHLVALRGTSNRHLSLRH